MLWWQKYIRLEHRTKHTKLFLQHWAMERELPNLNHALLHVAANLDLTTICIDQIHCSSNLFRANESICQAIHLAFYPMANTNAMSSFSLAPSHSIVNADLLNRKEINSFHIFHTDLHKHLYCHNSDMFL